MRSGVDLGGVWARNVQSDTVPLGVFPVCE